MYDGKLVEISGKRNRNIWKRELMSLNQTVRIRTLETCRGSEVNLRRITNLELTW
jgi:hypothetical protein